MMTANGHGVKRVSLGTFQEIMEVPNLLAVQKESVAKTFRLGRPAIAKQFDQGRRLIALTKKMIRT